MKTKLSCPVADELSLFKQRNSGLAVTCYVAATGSAGSVIGLHKAHYWLMHVQGVYSLAACLSVCFATEAAGQLPQ